MPHLEDSRIRFLVAEAAFVMAAKSENARVLEILAHVKGPHVVEINPEPSTTVRLITCVASAR